MTAANPFAANPFAASPFAGSLFDLAGRTALVTGSSRGIGRAIAGRLAQHGANAIIAGRKLDAAQDAAAAINAQAGGRAIAFAANITRTDELESLVAAGESAFGAIDILVANAGLHIHVGDRGRWRPDDPLRRLRRARDD
ncbi:MAG: SDR family NAD(P)-dependent oxidoreductase [Novosphingobium sp.]